MNEIISPNINSFPVMQNIAQLQESFVPKNINSIVLINAVNNGDLNGHIMNVKRVALQPSFPGYWQSKDGAYWQLTNSTITLEMFGGIADGNWTFAGYGTDNYPAITDAIAYVNASSKYNLNNDIYLPAFLAKRLELGPGVYFFKQSITINTQIHLKGYGAFSESTTSGSTLVFPAGVHGIVATTDAVWSTFEDFSLYACLYDPFGMSPGEYYTNSPGGWDGVTLAHGINSVTTILMNRLQITGFIGDGINTTGDAQSIHKVCCLQNGRNGITIYGGDGNAGLFTECTIDQNGQWGIFEDSFLGNMHIAHLSEGNGQWFPTQWVRTNQTCTVQEDGKMWWITPIEDGFANNLVAAQTSRPSTNNGVWYLALANTTGCYSPVWGQVLWADSVYTVIPGQEANMWTSQSYISNTVWEASPTNTSVTYVIWANNFSPYT
jgi:hypothetical protein